MSNAYAEDLPSVPDWLNKGDNAWQMTASTLVALQSMPGLVILYGSIVKKKWAVNSAFMALYAFAAVLLCWVLLCFRMAFGDELLPFWGKGAPALGQKYLIGRAGVPASTHYHSNGTIETRKSEPFYPMASLVYFQFTFAAITMILLAGSVLGRMNIKAWMAFVPLWLIFSYTVGAFSLWGGGFLYHWGVIDYSGGYVIHLSSGIAGFTAAYWVGPRLKSDRERFQPNNVLLMLAGSGLLWMGWSGFNGGAPYSANIDASIAILNTNVCAATSLLIWTSLDVIFFGKPSVIGAIQGMMTGLVCITPGAGVVQTWAAIVMGILSGSIPWFTMMILHKKSTLLQKVDDTLGVFHTHAVAGLLGGLLTGLLAEPVLCDLILPVKNSRGAFYGGNGGVQFAKQIAAALFVIGWNLVSTTIILLFIRLFMPLRMPDHQLLIGDDAVHGEEAYALWGDGEKYDPSKHAPPPSVYTEPINMSHLSNGARGVTIQLNVNHNPKWIIEESIKELELYNKLNGKNGLQPQTNSQDKWKKPNNGFLKLNVDACFDSQNKCGGAGGVIRDAEGQAVLAYAQPLSQVSSAYHAEVKALSLGLKIAVQAGFRSLEIESDCQQLINRIQQAEIDPGPASMLAEELKVVFKPLLNSCNFMFSPRSCNKVADKLARVGSVARVGNIWWHSVPPEVDTLLAVDLHHL